MRIMTYPHDLDMGGSQINAIDLSAEIQRLGHEVAVYGQPGVLVDRILGAGLEFIESPRVRMRPTPSIVSHLRAEMRSRRVEVVHGYEWPPTLEAVLACRGTGTAAVSTVLSMSVAPFIPDYVPLLVGTEQIAAAELACGRSHVGLMEPPIDTRLNSPDVSLPLRDFQREWDIDPDAFTVVVVSRLAHEMKLEGILTAIEAVRDLHRGHRIQLVIAGGGPAYAEVMQRAQEANEQAGATTVVVTGELLDPRPAYAVADVALGMGSSALRAMSFGKPLIVQGIEGFFEPLTADSLPEFLWQGWYGHGPGRHGAVQRLQGHLAALLRNPEERQRRSELSLRVARERFSLVRAAERQLEFYERALHRGPRRPLHLAAADAMSLTRFVRHEVGLRTDRWRGRASVEDFNSRAALSTAAVDANAARSRP
jgi:L-malate glycosyltransferase